MLTFVFFWQRAKDYQVYDCRAPSKSDASFRDGWSWDRSIQISFLILWPSDSISFACKCMQDSCKDLYTNILRQCVWLSASLFGGAKAQIIQSEERTAKRLRFLRKRGACYVSFKEAAMEWGVVGRSFSMDRIGNPECSISDMILLALTWLEAVLFSCIGFVLFVHCFCRLSAFGRKSSCMTRTFAHCFWATIVFPVVVLGALSCSLWHWRVSELRPTAWRPIPFREVSSWFR